MKSSREGFRVFEILKKGAERGLRAVARSNDRLVRTKRHKYKKVRQAISRSLKERHKYKKVRQAISRSLKGRMPVSKQGIRVLS